MNASRWTPLIVVVALAVFAPRGAVARPHPGPAGPPPGPEARWEAIAEELALTEAQKQAIAATHQESRQQQENLRAEVVRLEAQMHALMVADAPDQGAVLKLVQRIGDLRTEIRTNRIKTRLAVRAQLTPAQRTQLLLIEERLPRMRGGRSGGAGPRGHAGPEGVGPRGPRGDWN